MRDHRPQVGANYLLPQNVGPTMVGSGEADESEPFDPLFLTETETVAEVVHHARENSIRRAKAVPGLHAPSDEPKGRPGDMLALVERTRCARTAQYACAIGLSPWPWTAG